MIGSGWLFGALYTAQIAGPASIICWGIGGALIVMIAFTFAELATMLPLAGGIARYTQFSHGALVSFSMSWLAWLSSVAVAPTEVQAILQYATPFLPSLTHSVHDTVVLTTQGMGVACGLLLVISALNILGIRTITRYNNTMTVLKMLIPTTTALSLLYITKDHFNLAWDGPFMPYGWHGVLAALPAAVVFSFLGFREATSLAGEANNPRVAIPVAVIGSVLICTLLYTTIQWAFLGSLSPSMLTDGWAHLHFSGDAGPFASIALSLGMTWLAFIIFADSFTSPTGTALIYTATTARVNYAMAESGYAPNFFTYLNKHGVPYMAIFANFLIGLLLFFPLPGWQDLVKFQSIAIVLSYSVGPISLISLRRQAPDLERPFKVPFHYLQCFITFFICNLLAYWSGWDTIWRIMISVIIGIVILLIYFHKNKKPYHTLGSIHASWLLPYFIGTAVISYFGNFGGIGYIAFGWDFGLIALFSLAILHMATYNRQSDSDSQALLVKESLLPYTLQSLESDQVNDEQ